MPRYFRKMEEYNLNGPPLLSELSYPKPFSLEEFEEEMQEPIVMVMDTRMPYAYAGSHIPNSLSMWLGGTSVYPGWLLDTNQYIVFVLERPSDIDTVAPRLRRLGFDNMCGYLCGGMNEWQEAGKPINSIGTMSVLELKSKLERGELLLLDVREPNEWKEEGIVEGAKCIHFADLPDKIGFSAKRQADCGYMFGWQPLQHRRKHTGKRRLQQRKQCSWRHDRLDKPWLSNKKIVSGYPIGINRQFFAKFYF